MPLSFTPDQFNHDFHWLLVMGRLKRGVPVDQAQANMVAVAKQVEQTYPASNKGWSASVEPLQNNFLGDNVKKALWLLLGAVGFVLLIACANVANLLLARGTARQRELAVRSALGASNGDIVRQLITESVVLAGSGGLLGILLAVGLLRVIMRLLPPFALPSEAEVGLSVQVLLFTSAACVLSGLLFGVAPAWQAPRANLHDTLKEAGRAPGSGRHRLGRALVVVECALALTLLAGGGLAIHSLVKVANANLGFRADHLLTFNVPVPGERLKGGEQMIAFYSRLIERIEALPGVTAASVSVGMVVQGTNFGMPFSIAGKPVADPSARPGAGFAMVGANYYKTLGIEISQGRAFTDQDRAGSQRVAIVNEALVKQYLKGVNPLSQRLVIEQLVPGETKLGPAVEWQIVGVYKNVRNGGPRVEFPEIDVPFAQSPWNGASIAVRTAGEPASVQSSIAAVMRSIDPDLPMADVKTMDQLVHEVTAGDRFGALVFGGFAFIALVLAACGIYGVMSFTVAQRTHEIGLRMALGAGRSRVLAHVLREGMTTTALGIAVGAAGAYFVGRAMRSLVYDIEAIDPWSLSIVAATLLACALVACLVPARRAASVDPMVALRQE